MGTLPDENTSSPHLYSQELQLRLYQAFIFSIPILFSIILFLLFYLFYLKRRASSFSSPPPSVLPVTSNQATSFDHLAYEMGLKGEQKHKLPVVLFDEVSRAMDSQCCVCLGEFEMKEELRQVPLCKHVYHGDCIGHWLISNSTCPLCRCSIAAPATAIKMVIGLPQPLPVAMDESEILQRQDNDTVDTANNHLRRSSQQQRQEGESTGSNFTNHS